MSGSSSRHGEVILNLPVAPIQKALLDWYRRHARDLPWRRTTDPYHIWLSEVMLQQTQVDTALDYYVRFVEKFPTLDDLAAADVDEVMAVWAGLGYYRRARHFHQAVREVAATYEGAVPADPETFGALPGVGPYTQGAVLSIAFGQPIPAVDGNVLRVMSRLAGIHDPIDRAAGRRQVESVATQLMATEVPGDWNQAVMELGALTCRPRNPQCAVCPVHEWCRAYSAGSVEALPVVEGRTKVRVVERLVAVVSVDVGVVFCRRPDTGLLAGMWDLPALEGEPGSWPLPGDRETALARHLEDLGMRGVRVHSQLGTVSHRFSHVEWRMWVFGCTAQSVATSETLQIVPSRKVEHTTVARATGRALDLAFDEQWFSD